MNTKTSDAITSYLSRKKIAYIDLRESKGCLWIPGDRELLLKLEPLRRAGITLHFSASGGSATKHQSAWWTKDRYNDDIEIDNHPQRTHQDYHPQQTPKDAPLAKRPQMSLPKKENRTEAASREPATSEDLEKQISESSEAFIIWLESKNYQLYAAKKMAGLIKCIDRFAQKYGFITQSLYTINDYVRLANLWAKIREHEKFPAYNRTEYDRLPNAMNHYMLFRKETTVTSVTPKKKIQSSKDKTVKSNDDSKSAKNNSHESFSGKLGEFHTWLVSSRIIDGDTADNYCRALAIVEWYVSKYKVGPSFLKADSATAEKIRADLLNIPSFWKSDRQGKGRYNDAMTLFVRYLKGEEDNAKDSKKASSTKESPIAKKQSEPLKTAISGTKGTTVQSKPTSSVSAKTTTDSLVTPKSTPPEAKDIPKPQTKVSLFADSTHTAMIKKAEGIVLKADLEGITVESLSIALHTSMVDAKRFIADSQKIITLDGVLYHIDALVDFDEAADAMEQILDKLMERNNGYVTSTQLYEFARSNLQMFLNINDIDDQRKVFDLAQFLFEKIKYHGKQYVFQSKAHISRVASTVSTNLDVMLKFAREQGGIFTEEDLIAYLQKVGMKTGNLHAQMQLSSSPIFFYYAPRTYITAESMRINSEWLDTVKSALDRLFADVGDHLVLRRIQPGWFSLLPSLPYGKQWTHLLLQSILRMYNDKLGARTIYAMEYQAGDTLHAMIAKDDSWIKTFPDVVASVLVDDQIEQRRFEAEELRQLLVKLGVIAGNELIWKMPKALAKDERFVWSMDGKTVNCVL